MKSIFSILIALILSCAVTKYQTAEAQESTHTIGGSIFGLSTGKSVTLLLNGTTPLSLTSNGAFNFPTALSAGANYLVSIAIQPSGQFCLVANGYGINISEDVITINVSCIDTYTISGSVSGLNSSGLVLRMNSTSLIVANGATAFKFATALSDGSSYSVGIGIQPVGVTCSVSNNSGVINAANVSNVSVTCNKSYIVGGSISGLTASGLTLKLNGATSKIIYSGSAAFTFSTALIAGSPYSVTIFQNPVNQTCAISNGEGTIGTSNVSNIAINCLMNTLFPPYGASDSRVIVDVGTVTLNPRNSWSNLPSGFSLGQVIGRTAGTLSDTVGFIPNTGGYIYNSTAFPSVLSSQGTVYILLDRSALSVDNSTGAGTVFFDSNGNAGGGYGSNAATAFTLYDNTNNLMEWVMGPQGNSIQVLDAGSWIAPGQIYANSHGSINLDEKNAEIVFTWQGLNYWSYFDGVPVAHGTLNSLLPSTGLFSQIVIGGYLTGTSSMGKPLGPYAIKHFQLSTYYSPPPVLSNRPLVAFYGDSFVVAAGGVTGDIPNLFGSPSIDQVNSVQAQMDTSASVNAAAGVLGQDGFIRRVQAYAQKGLGGYLQLYTAAQSGHGWAYTNMGGTNSINTPAIDDFNLGKTGFSDAMNSVQPDYIFAFGSVNDVNNGVPGDIVGDTQTHFDYWANNNPRLKRIYYVETLSWELATGASTSRGGPAGWKAEMERQRTLLRNAFGSGYLAGARHVPVTYITTYDTWVNGVDSPRFLTASNPDNYTQSSNSGSLPDGHPDAEGEIQIADAYVWPYLKLLIQ